MCCKSLGRFLHRKKKKNPFFYQWEQIVKNNPEFFDYPRETPKITRTNLATYINKRIEKVLNDKERDDKCSSKDKKIIEEFYKLKASYTQPGKTNFNDKLDYLKKHPVETNQLKFVENFIKNPSIKTKHRRLIEELFDLDPSWINEIITDKNKSNKSKIITIIIVLLVVLPLIIYFVIDHFNWSSTQIDYPENQDVVPEGITIEGKHHDIKPTELLFITLRSECDDNRYFPQKKPVEIDPENKNWYYDMEIGTESDSGCEFDLYLSVVDTTSPAYLQLKDYLSKKNKHGRQELYLNYVDKITVIRK
jgi:hypothetical protein